MKNILFCSPRGSVGGICHWTDNILSYAESVNASDMKLIWFYSKVPKRGNDRQSLIWRIYSGLKAYLPFIKGLKRKIMEHHFDIAHFSTSGSISFARDYLALKMCRKANIQTVLHFHFGRMPYVLASNTLEKKLFDICIPYISKFVAIDEDTFNALVTYGCKNVHLVPNPLSPQVETIINELPVLKRSEDTIVYAGHVLRAKGVFELVGACKNIPGIKLEILGQCSSEIRAELFKSAGSEALKWLIIRGNCSMQQVIEAMKRCAVFVLPSYTEGFPNVIIEAMACETPIVATSVGAIPQMLACDNEIKCGVIVPPRNSNELQNAIQRVLTDSEFATEIRMNAYKKVHSLYSMENIWAKLKNIWLN